MPSQVGQHSSAGDLAIAVGPAQQPGIGSVGIGLREAKNISAQMIPYQQPSGYMEHIPKPVETAWVLRTLYKGNTQNVDLEKFKDFDKKQLDELWTEVKAYLPPGAKGIRVNLGTLVIRYTDHFGKVQYLDVSKTDAGMPEKLINLIFKVRNVAQKVWIDLKLGYQFNDAATRANSALKPLQIPTDDWKGKMPKSVEQFVKDGHFEQLERVSGRSEDEVIDSIMATEAYIQELKRRASDEKRRLQNLIGGNHFHEQPVSEQNEIKNSSDKLNRFIAELEEIDRLALYWAVGVWGDRDPETIPKEERMRLAGLISEGVETTLRRSLKPGVDDRWWIFKKLGIREKEANGILGAGPFIKTYAGDVGDLIIPEKLDYIRRLDESDREERAPSLAEFIAQAMTYREKPEQFKLEQAFDLMHLGFKEDVRGNLIEGAKDALEAAHDIAIPGYILKDNTLKFTDSHLKNLAAGGG